MRTLEGQRAVVVGGSSGLGLGLVEALAARSAEVTVVGRDAERLAGVKERLGVAVVAGDAADPAVAQRVLRDVRPSILAVTAGVAPSPGLLHEQTWDSFSSAWNSDVKIGLFWAQAALRLPLARGSRVLLTSSGAGRSGTPISGGYAGAKRMLWLMAGYANTSASVLDLGIRFQAVVPLQIVGDTGVGRVAAAAHAHWKQTTPEEFLASFGRALSARDFGEHVATILADPQHEGGTAFGINADPGIVPLDG